MLPLTPRSQLAPTRPRNALLPDARLFLYSYVRKEAVM